MPAVWSIRGNLYRASLLALIAGLPVHLVSMCVPFWLVFEHTVMDGNSISARFGLWQYCLETNCTLVNADSKDEVGDWLISVKLLMLMAFFIYLVAVTLASVQNFLSRRRLSRLTSLPYCGRLVHRDCEVPEDLGFAAGFLGVAAHIVFMLCTREMISDGARYSWGFALGFIATTTATVSSLALTKTHFQPLPRPPIPGVRQIEMHGMGGDAGRHNPRDNDNDDLSRTHVSVGLPNSRNRSDSAVNSRNSHLVVLR